jgi:uncharacterized protein YodC (DUF2158 family)
MEEPLRVGDVCRLRAGGPDVTIETTPAPDLLDGELWVRVAWFTARGVMRAASIACASLEKVEPPAGLET